MEIPPPRSGWNQMIRCLCSILLLVLPLSAAIHRGVWFWGSTILPDGSPHDYGSSDTVGDDVLEDDLLNAYLDIRSHLDTAGFTDMPIHADIPFFFDKLPIDGGSIAWVDATDRDNWFAAVNAVLDGVSIMTFSKDTASELEVATGYERTSIPGNARIGIQPKIGPSETWLDITEFNVARHELEASLPSTECTDIENYAFRCHAHATTGAGIIYHHRGTWMRTYSFLPDGSAIPLEITPDR